MKIVIATHKTWNVDNANRLKDKYASEHELVILEEKEKLNLKTLDEVAPDYIFFPHWSYLIPAEIYEKYTCVVFHMTDLPFGRGGSPLQNLIVRGITETKISAIKVVRALDAGPVYMKEPLALDGSAGEIFKRASDLIFERMIPQFLEKEQFPCEQTGEPVIFKRRTPEESELKEDMSLMQIYDHIRMLDAEGYPNAYMTLGKYRLSFTGAKSEQGVIRAEVEIREES